MEALALDELVEFPSRVMTLVPTNTGIVGRRWSTEFLVLSNTTTSDIVGLAAAVA